MEKFKVAHQIHDEVLVEVEVQEPAYVGTWVETSNLDTYRYYASIPLGKGLIRRKVRRGRPKYEKIPFGKKPDTLDPCINYNEIPKESVPAAALKKLVEADLESKSWATKILETLNKPVSFGSSYGSGFNFVNTLGGGKSWPIQGSASDIAGAVASMEKAFEGIAGKIKNIKILPYESPHWAEHWSENWPTVPKVVEDPYMPPGMALMVSKPGNTESTFPKTDFATTAKLVAEHAALKESETLNVKFPTQASKGESCKPSSSFKEPFKEFLKKEMSFAKYYGYNDLKPMIPLPFEVPGVHPHFGKSPLGNPEIKAYMKWMDKFQEMSYSIMGIPSSMFDSDKKGGSGEDK